MTTDETFALEGLLRVLQEAQRAPDDAPVDAIRTETLCAALGRSRPWVHRRLRALMDNGLVEHVRVPYRTIDGRLGSVSAYRVIRQDSVE